MQDSTDTTPSQNPGFAVVTGASSGIGRELARDLARRGYDLLICAEDADIHAAARELSAAGTRVDPLQVDLADYEGVETLVSTLQAYRRPLDVIAINAGVGVGGNFVEETDIDEELNLIDLNVVSTVHLAKLVLPEMVRRGSGRILFTSSIASTMPGPFYAVYAASKAFVQSFAEAIRNELKDTGVVVTALMPGATDTDFFGRAHMEDTQVGQGKKDDPAEVARQGLDALFAGKDHIVAGSLKNKVQAAIAKVIPETTAAGLHRQQVEPKDRAAS